MSGIGVKITRIDGLKEIEDQLRVLREEMGVKTGGILLRGLNEGAKIVVKRAKQLAPQVDPFGFGKQQIANREDKTRRRKAGEKFRGKIASKAAAGRLIAARIRSRMLAVSHPISQGRPTVIVFVSNRGYERGGILSRRTNTGKRRLYWKNPGSSPGYWWWVEFGTSRFPAQPFMRPAFAQSQSAATESAKRFMQDEIAKRFANFKKAA